MINPISGKADSPRVADLRANLEIIPSDQVVPPVKRRWLLWPFHASPPADAAYVTPQPADLDHTPHGTRTKKRNRQRKGRFYFMWLPWSRQDASKVAPAPMDPTESADYTREEEPPQADS